MGRVGIWVICLFLGFGKGEARLSEGAQEEIFAELLFRFIEDLGDKDLKEELMRMFSGWAKNPQLKAALLRYLVDRYGMKVEEGKIEYSFSFSSGDPKK